MDKSVVDGVVIREFRQDDKALVGAFFDQMGGETRAFFDVNGGNRAAAMKFFDGTEKTAAFFLADHGGKMVGYVALWNTDNFIPWLGIAVSEEFKGHGLGGRLLAFAENFARGVGMGGILLTTHVANIRAQALYKRCGYVHMGMHTSGELLFLLRFNLA